jgi:hypothetical protein
MKSHVIEGGTNLGLVTSYRNSDFCWHEPWKQIHVIGEDGIWVQPPGMRVSWISSSWRPFPRDFCLLPISHQSLLSFLIIANYVVLSCLFLLGFPSLYLWQEKLIP